MMHLHPKESFSHNKINFSEDLLIASPSKSGHLFSGISTQLEKSQRIDLRNIIPNIINMPYLQWRKDLEFFLTWN